MAFVKLVTNKKGTVLRNMSFTGSTTGTVDQAARTLESIIFEERDIIHVEVDYEGCDDSDTVQYYDPWLK